MLDGRIDVQGTVEDLKTEGILKTIATDAATEQSTLAHERADDVDNVEEEGDKKKSTSDGGNDGAAKRPRQLVKDEAREIGSVKWRIYRTYMRASSYFTWIALFAGIVLYQLLGVSEKLWIKQWGEVRGLYFVLFGQI